MNGGRRLVAALVLLCCAAPACGGGGSAGGGTAAFEDRALTIVYPPDYTPPELAEAAKAPQFQQSLTSLSRETNATIQWVRNLAGAAVFYVPHAAAEQGLERWHTAYLARGAFVIRYDTSFGARGEPDAILVLPTTDKYAAIRAAGTQGLNYDLTNADIVRWLQDLEAEHPFVLLGAGFDFIDGRFRTPPADADALARRMYEFCPDIVEQGTGDVARLADELRAGTLYLWWD